MAKNKELELAIRIGGKVDKSLSGAASSAESTISKIGKTAGKIAKVSAVAFAAVGTAAVAAYGAAIEAGKEYETSLKKVSTIADTSAISIEEISSQVLELSNRTGEAASALNEAVYQAISGGVNSTEAVAFVETATKLAGGGFTDTSTAVDILTTSLNAFGTESGLTAESVSDMLLMTQNLGKTDVGQLASSMGKIIPTAVSTNVAMDDLCGMYAVMTANGVATAESTTYMNSMLNELGKSSSNVSKVFKKASGGLSFGEAMNEGWEVTEILDVLNKAASESGVAMSELFSSSEAAKAANILLSNSDKLNNAITQMGESAGATESAYAAMTDTFEHRSEVIKNLVKNIGIDLFMQTSEALSQLLETGASALSSLTPMISEFVSIFAGSFNEMIPIISDLAQMIVSDFMPIFGQIIGDVMPEIMGLIMSIMPLVSRIVTTLLPPMISLFSKLLPPVVTIINMVLPILTQLLDALMPSFDVIVSTILPLIVQLIETCLPLIQPIISTVLPVIVQLIQQLLPPALTLISAILPVVISLIETLSPILGIVLELITPILDLVIALIAPILQVFDALSPLFEILGNLIITILEPIMPLIEQLADAFSAYLAPSLEFVTDLFSGISDAISGVLGWIGDAASKIGDFFGKLFGGGEVDVAVNAVSGGEELPQFADGGIVTRATQAIVGEGGEPEAIIPLSKLDEVLSGGGTVQVTFSPTFNISGAVDKQAITEATDEAYQQFVAYMERFAKEQRRFAF